MAYVNYIEDERGDLAEITFYCSQACADDEYDEYAVPLVGRIETDYSTFCAHCDELLWTGLEDEEEEPGELMIDRGMGVYFEWTPPAEQLGFVLTFAA